MHFCNVTHSCRKADRRSFIIIYPQLQKSQKVYNFFRWDPWQVWHWGWQLRSQNTRWWAENCSSVLTFSPVHRSTLTTSQLTLMRNTALSMAEFSTIRYRLLQVCTTVSFIFCRMRNIFTSSKVEFVSEAVSKILSLYKGKQGTPTRWTQACRLGRLVQCTMCAFFTNHPVFTVWFWLGTALEVWLARHFSPFQAFQLPRSHLLNKKWQPCSFGVILNPWYFSGVHAANISHPPHTSCTLWQADSWFLHKVQIPTP